MVNEYEIKKQICEIGKRIYNKGMVASNDGNISVKLNDNEFLCTPTGVSKGFMTPEYICKVDANGKVIQANAGFKPSSEIKMHMRVYRERPDVKSVLQHYDAVLLANHGALSFSDSLLNAYHKMESVEFYAQLMYQAKVLGGPKQLTDAQVQRLYEIRRQFGLKGKHPADICPNAKAGKPSCHGCGGHCSSGTDADTVAAITKLVLEQLGK